jgi:hypothetical protein
MQSRTVNFLPRFAGALKDTHHMRNVEKAPSGAVPPIIARHVCLYPEKGKPGIAKPATPPPEPKPERTLEQRIADEVERRMKNHSSNFFLGFLVGELIESFFHKHDRD